jgi:hypothetical protein
MLHLHKSRQSGEWRDALAVGIVGLVALAALFVWLDDVHISTTNGMYKSIRVESWVKSFASGKLDYSNYMYYPLMAVLCRGLDLVGIYPGMAWKQLAAINVAFAAASLAIVFVLARTLTGRRDVALLATLLHLGSAFFLMLAVTSEDILPGYTLVLLAMTLAALWFAEPTARRVAIVGVVFTFGWLLEWRLLFPALPAFALALLLAPVPLRRRTTSIGVLLLSILVTAEIVCLFWDGHDGSGQIHQILWTGKGLDTGWGGFAVEKIALTPIGNAEYLLGGRNLAVTADIRAHCWEWIASLLLLAVLLVVAVALVWRRRSDHRAVAASAVFLGTFAAGEVFNLYSQPQDPQMQVNIMAWVTLAWALVVAAIVPPPRRSAIATYAAATLLSLAPLAYNLNALAPNRGSDSAQLAALSEIERNVDPARTVFLYFGFESIASWQYLVWTHRWAGVCDVGQAPSAQPKFKWISVVRTLVDQPNYSAAEHAAALRREIDCAFDKGYRVVASDVWQFSVDTLSGQLITLRGTAHAAALHAALHDAYEGRELFTTRRTNPFYELRRR